MDPPSIGLQFPLHLIPSDLLKLGQGFPSDFCYTPKDCLQMSLRILIQSAGLPCEGLQMFFRISDNPPGLPLEIKQNPMDVSQSYKDIWSTPLGFDVNHLKPKGRHVDSKEKPSKI